MIPLYLYCQLFQQRLLAPITCPSFLDCQLRRLGVMLTFCNIKNVTFGTVIFVKLHSHLKEHVADTVILVKLHSPLKEHVADVVISMLLLGVVHVDRRFTHRLGQTKNYKIGICCFSAKHTALRRRGNNDWLDRNQDNVTEWRDMPTRGI